jgi:hypothetical protein
MTRGRCKFRYRGVTEGGNVTLVCYCTGLNDLTSISEHENTVRAEQVLGVQDHREIDLQVYVR